MLAFECDYLEGAHEKILNRLIETNMEKLPGYGADPYCASAREKILDACQCPEGEVFFLVGGTQTNATVIDGLLSSYAVLDMGADIIRLAKEERRKDENG